jgi:hypothetical protein
MLYTSLWSRFELTTSVVIGTDCTGSCKSNYHMITTMTAPIIIAYMISYMTSHISYLISYGSWIYKMLWVRILIRERCTTLCDKVFQWLVTGRWFSPGTLFSNTNTTGHHDITDILLKVVLSTITLILLCLIWFLHQRYICSLPSLVKHETSILHNKIKSNGTFKSWSNKCEN